MKRKINQPSDGQKKARTQDKGSPSSCEGHISSEVFQGLNFHIHPANFGIGRLKIFENQVRKLGGEIQKSLSEESRELTHVIFEESVDSERAKKLVNPVHFPRVVFVKCSWLSLCIRKKLREAITGHEVLSNNITPDTSKCKESNLQESSNENTKVDKPYSQESKADDGLKVISVESREDDSVRDVSSEEKSRPILEHQSSPECSYKTDSKFDTENEFIEEVEKETNIIEENKYQLQENCNEKYFLKPFPKHLQEKFACSKPSSSQVKGFNSHITSELEKLASAYKSKNDTWRAVGYQKAISAIRNYPKEITSREEALAIRGVGARLADKVAEIIDSGKLRKVAEVCDGEETQTLQLFMGVWGAGPNTAQSWYIQGFRTLDDLRTKASLTRHQQIGLKYYDDINSRIPRDEVKEIEDYVKKTALSIKKGLIVNVCGSYRRGKATCGDVDILITHPDGFSHKTIFKPILHKLKETGFLTDDLVTQDDNGNQKKYLGVCLLPGKGRKHRRLDVIVVPYAEYAPAIMYFTGSAHFNRSMRLLAIKMGMSLSEHGLRVGVVRKGREKLTAGSLLDTPTEESIFVHLGLEYRSPQERDH